MSEKDGALTLYVFKFKSDVKLNEMELCNKLHPDGKRVAYITSNFIVEYHPDYEYLRPVPKVKTSNKGRKKKPPKPRTKKKNNGNCTSFSCNTTYGVIHPDDRNKVYGIKIFRINSGNIPSISKVNDDLATTIINTAFEFIMSQIQCNVSLTELRIDLHNKNVYYPIDKDSGMGINNYRLKKRICGLDNSNISLDIYGETRKVYVYFNNSRIYTLFIFKVKAGKKYKFYQIQVHHTGRIYALGGNNDAITGEFVDIVYDMIDKNKDYLIQKSFIAR